MTIRELWHTSPSHSEIRIKAVNSFKETDVMIKSEYSLISAGTERIVATGAVPRNIEEEMAVPGMEGSFHFPIKYGYSLVGKVIHGPPRLLDKYLHIMHPHQDYVFTEGHKYNLIPKDFPLKRAVYTPIMETALNVLWDSDISAGDRVLVCGFGLVGAVIALLLSRIPAVFVTILENDADRCNVASSFGFQLFSEYTVPRGGFDCAVNTSGAQEGLQICIDSTANDASILEASWYGNYPVQVNLGTHFHPGRKKIISSQVSRIPLAKSGRFTYERRKATVFELLKDDRLDRIPLREISFEEAPQIFDSIRKKLYNQLCTIIRY
jgi:threonine dehydrogenase-like Zn-dependent dehydrogenase